MKTVYIIAFIVVSVIILLKELKYIDKNEPPKPAHQVTLCTWIFSSYYFFQWLYLNKGITLGGGRHSNIVPVRCHNVGQEEFMPTLKNLGQWSLDFKFFFFVALITTLIAILLLLKKNKKWIFLSILNGLIISVYCYLLLSFTNHLWYTMNEGLFVIKALLRTGIDFVIGCAYSLGLCGVYALPLFLVFPNTMAALSTSKRKSVEVNVETNTNSTSDNNSVHMPNIIYDSEQNSYRLVNRYSGQAVYQDDNGNTVTIYNEDVSGTNATTSAGNFHWY